MNTIRTIALFACLAGVLITRGAEEKAASGWSAELLNQILKTEPQPESRATPAAPGEMVLRTYHLTHLRVGEAGRPQNVLAILGRLLPAGSSINPDVTASSLHILTTPAAHQAVWDYLSAVDTTENGPSPGGGVVPEDVRNALKKLADTSDQSARVMTAIGSLKADVSNEIALIDARQRQQTIRVLLGAAGFGILVTGTVVWMLRRRPTSVPDPVTPTMALAPEQLTTALAPVHDRMRNDMLSLLNEVAIKLQAQHHEQQKLVREQQLQLENARLALAEERQQFITDTGSMVVQAVERVDATTAKLAKQQDKVAELVQELQDTVRELDETKDNLHSKQVELEQERAKIAALSILLEEGAALPSGPNGSNHGPVAPSARNGAPISLPCTHPNPKPPVGRMETPPQRFEFLPPDQSEI